LQIDLDPPLVRPIAEMGAEQEVGTDGRIGIVVGVPGLIDLFDEATFAELPGGILERPGWRPRVG
jgi:hypothetical protein